MSNAKKRISLTIDADLDQVITERCGRKKYCQATRMPSIRSSVKTMNCSRALIT